MYWEVVLVGSVTSFRFLNVYEKTQVFNFDKVQFSISFSN